MEGGGGRAGALWREEALIDEQAVDGVGDDLVANAGQVAEGAEQGPPVARAEERPEVDERDTALLTEPLEEGSDAGPPIVVQLRR